MSATYARNDVGASSLIGVVDDVVSEKKLSWEFNKIGGLPDWMRKNAPHPSCQACGRSLILITQLYCPLEGSPYHRTLYIFICHSSQCQQKSMSFRVFRSQTLAVTAFTSHPQQQQPQQPLSPRKDQVLAADSLTSNTDWCEDADDWGADDGEEWADVVGDQGKPQHSSYAGVLDSEGQNLNTDKSTVLSAEGLEGTLLQLTLHTSMPPGIAEVPHEECMAAAGKCGEDIPQLVSYFVNVFKGPRESAERALSHELALLKEYQQREGVCITEWEEHDKISGSRGNGSRGGSEGYEKATAKHGDRIFQKFAKRVQLCPQQCIRYHYNGNPIWLTAPTQQQYTLPRCDYCGSHRHFEFQLMPALVSHLQFCDRELSIDFGVVVVYTCSRSCWIADSTEFYREEVVVVQKDPDSSALAAVQKQIIQQT